MNSSIKSFVDNLITSRKVAVFSKTYCPYCTFAKDALKSFNMSKDIYEVVEIEARDDCDAIQDYLKELSGAR